MAGRDSICADDDAYLAHLEAESRAQDRRHALRGFWRLNSLAERYYLDLEYDETLRAPFLSMMAYAAEARRRLADAPVELSEPERADAANEAANGL